jgi:hypothetical protein
MWPLLIVEIEPDGPTGGNIVWEWHVWDHLIQDADPTKDNYGNVGDHPELVNINYGHVNTQCWLHANSIDFHPEFDQIVISSRKLSEVLVIDHSTTTEEAAGHTGGTVVGAGTSFTAGATPRFIAGVPRKIAISGWFTEPTGSTQACLGRVTF